VSQGLRFHGGHAGHTWADRSFWIFTHDPEVNSTTANDEHASPSARKPDQLGSVPHPDCLRKAELLKVNAMAWPSASSNAGIGILFAAAFYDAQAECLFTPK
jgi:hypothetical protein